MSRVAIYGLEDGEPVLKAVVSEDMSVEGDWADTVGDSIAGRPLALEQVRRMWDTGYTLASIVGDGMQAPERPGWSGGG